MIPDKIYMPNELLSEEWQRHIEGDDTEYIRKDLLLEWANNVKQGLIIELEKYGEPNEQRIFAFQEFIDKLNSL